MICPKCHKTALAFMSGSFQVSPWFCNCGWVDKSIPDSEYKRQAEIAEAVQNPETLLFPKKEKNKDERP